MDTFVEDEAPRRRTPLKAISAAILLLVGTAFGLWAWVNSAAERKWARMLARTAELEGELPAAGGPRPVIDPRPLPGDAWDDYADAARGFDSSHVEQGIHPHEIPLATTLDDAPTIGSIIANRPELIEHLRLGSRRTQAGTPREGRTPGEYADIARLAFDWAEFQAEEGRNREGIDLLGVALQLGRDLCALGTLDAERSGLEIVRKSLNVFKGMLQKGLSREELEEVARILSVLDQGFPSCRAGLRGFFPRKGRAFAQWNLGIDGAELRVWRNAWTARIGVTRLFEQMEQWMRRLQEHDGEPWSATAEACREIEQESRAYPTPHPSLFFPTIHVVDSLKCRATMRILRAAAILLATRKFVPLADPFGDTLRFSQDEKGFKIWSVGEDGVDQKGQPLENLDLVIEVWK